MTDAAEGAHLRRKESDPSVKPDSCNKMRPPAMFISGSNWPESSPQVFTNALQGESVSRCVTSIAESELPRTSPCSMSDAGVMVEELTLRNYKNLNVAVVGSSNSREGMQIRQGQWQHLYQLAGGLGKGSLHGDTVSQGKEMVAMRKPQTCKQSHQDCAEISEHLINSDNTISNNTSSPRGTPVPASGFSKFFVKNVLKGKGVVYKHPEVHDGFGVVASGQDKEKAACVTQLASNESLNSSAKTDDPSLKSIAGAAPGSFRDEISLREWLKPSCRKINKAECLHIFRQIVELVDLAHSQQVALQDIRPSYFKLLPSNRIKYVGSLARRELLESVMDQYIPSSEHHLSRKRYLEKGSHADNSLRPKHLKLMENMKFGQQHPRFPARFDFKCKTVKEVDINSIGAQDSGFDTRGQHNSNPEQKTQNRSDSPSVSNIARQKLTSVNVQLEEKWYTSPEELNERVPTFSSNIYSLGVLLFELFCCFESWEVHAAAMSDLRHRILPPNFLSENPKVVGFCLWLLHPESSSRPTTREILQSELICVPRELLSGDETSLSVDEDDTESELLLHFLISLIEQKQKQASKLAEDIGCLEADAKEVERRHLLRTTGMPSWTHKDSSSAREPGFLHNKPLCSEALSRLSSSSNMNEARLMRNINQLENAYFSMRSQIQLAETDSTARLDNDLLKIRDRWPPLQNENEEWGLNQKPIDHLGVFFDGLCKYAHYSKFEVLATLRNGDLFNSANVICSLSFDRDEDYFAAAGVSKKIKIFEFGALLNDSVDIHYPVIEMSCKSKLSCVCWNNYIKNYLASTDYDGVVQLWDASTGQGFSQYIEHEGRAWSVDFSQVDPTKLASGSDDCSVRQWSINERKCIGKIRNIANVCCVQFSAHSSHLLAFGSADYKTYCYDLRNTNIPWCTLVGHGKAVSYVKFLDSETLVSASTDNTLKLWDLNKTNSSGLSTSACSLTFTGHTNEKNFVGLSVSDGYIACGSETNEVYAYYRSLPMPITSHKFGSTDPISGQETGDDNGQFVSSVCWRRKSNMVVAANSSGSIKLLQMV